MSKGRWPFGLKCIEHAVCRSSRDGLLLSSEKKVTKDSQGALPVSPAGSVGVQRLPLANNTPLETPQPFEKGRRVPVAHN